ncbi:hypothetical protein Tco_1184520 [Tanacetum coccineum]
MPQEHLCFFLPKIFKCAFNKSTSAAYALEQEIVTSLALIQNPTLKSSEKDQQDKLKAVKARLLYGNEFGRNPRNHEESHYSESKTPTARTEPRRRNGRKHSRSPSPVVRVFRRLKQNRSPLPRLRPRKEGGMFNNWEEKNQARIHALIVTTRVPKQGEPRYLQESIIIRAHRPEEPTDIQRAKTAKGVTGSPNQKGIGQIPTKTISPSLERMKKETLSRPGSDTLTSQGQGCLAMSRLTTEVGI